MFRKGFVGAGVRDIVAEASAPQGSFTNHFRSKEAFAREVLDRYFEHVKGLIAQTLVTRAARHANGCAAISTSSPSGSLQIASRAVV